jgi:hypothetical protein
MIRRNELLSPTRNGAIVADARTLVNPALGVLGGTGAVLEGSVALPPEANEES